MSAFLAQQPTFLPLPALLFLALALVVRLAALAEPDFAVGPTALPILAQRHQGLAAALRGSGEMAQLAGLEQYFARAIGLGLDVCGGARQWRHIRADEPGFARAQDG